MTVARSVADVLSDHVQFEVECIDRMYCNVYVPQLQHAGGLLGFVQRHLGFPVASTAPLAKITDRFAREVHRFAEARQVPWVDFVKGGRQRRFGRGTCGVRRPTVGEGPSERQCPASASRCGKRAVRRWPAGEPMIATLSQSTVVHRR